MTAVPSDRHLAEVCRPGRQGDACAYLSMRPLTGGSVWSCAKDDPIVSEVIKTRLAQGTMKATGDNCSGPPDFATAPDLGAALAEVGRLIEEMPAGQRRDALDRALDAMTERDQRRFLMGVFVYVHALRVETPLPLDSCGCIGLQHRNDCPLKPDWTY